MSRKRAPIRGVKAARRRSQVARGKGGSRAAKRIRRNLNRAPMVRLAG